MNSDKYDLAAFLAEFPLKSKWLDDIVDALRHRPSGTAHVSDLVHDLWKERDVPSMNETITRRINDFCSDAADFEKSEKYDLFERVFPATYRLRSYPNVPDTLDVVRIEFEDSDMQWMWETYRALVNDKAPDKWPNMTNRQRLDAFTQWMAPGGKPRLVYERRGPPPAP